MNPALTQTLLRALEWACRLAVAVMFVLAAVPKLLDPVAFAKAITNYRVAFPIVGQDYIYLVAMLMPALELVAAVALLLPRWKKAGALVCGSLLVLFIVLIGQAVARGLNIDCGCFGTGAVGAVLAQKVGWRKNSRKHGAARGLRVCVSARDRRPPARGATRCPAAPAPGSDPARRCWTR